MAFSKEQIRQILTEDECSASYFGFADNFSELDLLRSTIEDLIQREETAEIDRLDEQARNLPPGVSADFWADNHPYWWEHIIAPQFRGAFFLALMSAVELHLGRLVRDAGLVANAPIEASDLKGAFYSRSRKFLRLFCGIDAPNEASWQRLLKYYAVRNLLVHNGGLVGDGGDSRQVESFKGEVPGLVISQSHLELQAAFCSTAHQDCHAFLFEVWQELVVLCRSKRSE